MALQPYNGEMEPLPQDSAPPKLQSYTGSDEDFEPIEKPATGIGDSLANFGRSAGSSLVHGTGETLKGLGSLSGIDTLKNWGESTNDYAKSIEANLPKDYQPGFVGRTVNTLAESAAPVVGTALAGLAGSIVGTPATGAAAAGTLGATLFGSQGYQSSKDAEEQRIAQLGDADLGKIPQYNELIQSGMSPEQARAQFSQDASQRAAGVGGLFGAALGVIPGGRLVDGVYSGVAKSLLPYMSREAARVVGKGAAESALFGGINAAGQVAQNVTDEVPTSPFENVGAAAASGLLPGFALGAARQFLERRPSLGTLPPQEAPAAAENAPEATPQAQPEPPVDTRVPPTRVVPNEPQAAQSADTMADQVREAVEAQPEPSRVPAQAQPLATEIAQGQKPGVTAVALSKMTDEGFAKAQADNVAAAAEETEGSEQKTALPSPPSEKVSQLSQGDQPVEAAAKVAESQKSQVASKPSGEHDQALQEAVQRANSVSKSAEEPQTSTTQPQSSEAPTEPAKQSVKTPVGDVEVDSTKDVPYLGSSSTSGKVYIDKDWNPIIQDGPLKGLDRTPMLVTHEAIEAKLEKDGDNYSNSHADHAEPAEHALLLQTLDLKPGTPQADAAIKAYEDSYKGDLKAAADKQNPDIPSDLIQKPYDHPHTVKQRELLDEVDAAQKNPAEAPENVKTGATEPENAQTTPNAEKVVGISNARVEADRIMRGADPLTSESTPSNQELWDQARQKALDDPGYGQRLAKDVAENKRHTTEAEEMSLLHERARLSDEMTAASAAHEAATTDTDKASTYSRLVEADRQNELVDQALRYTGTRNSRALNVRNAIAKLDYSLASMTSRAKIARGEALPKDVQKELADISTRFKANDEQFAERQKPQEPPVIKKNVPDRQQAKLRDQISKLEQTLKERLSVCPL